MEEPLLEIMVTPRQVDAVSDRDDASTSQETHQQATMSIKGVEACCGPVSYTHLTLPTICSV